MIYIVMYQKGLIMAKKYESDLINDVYDYLFENPHNIGTNFLDEFPNASVDSDNACIYLNHQEYGNFKIKMERV
jgi:hypothetical protein